MLSGNFQGNILYLFSGREPIASIKPTLPGHCFEGICSGTENQKSRLKSFNLFPRYISLPWLAEQMDWPPCPGSLNPRRDEVSLNISVRNKPVTKPSNVQVMLLGPPALAGAFPVWDSSDQMLASVLQILQWCAWTISREKPAHVRHKSSHAWAHVWNRWGE